MIHLAEYQLHVDSRNWRDSHDTYTRWKFFTPRLKYFTIVSLASGLLQIVPSAHGMCCVLQPAFSLYGFVHHSREHTGCDTQHRNYVFSQCTTAAFHSYVQRVLVLTERIVEVSTVRLRCSVHSKRNLEKCQKRVDVRNVKDDRLENKHVKTAFFLKN